MVVGILSAVVVRLGMFPGVAQDKVPEVFHKLLNNSASLNLSGRVIAS